MQPLGQVSKSLFFLEFRFWSLFLPRKLNGWAGVWYYLPLAVEMSEACHDKCHCSPLSEAGASAASHTQTAGVYYQASKAGFYPNPHLWKKKMPVHSFVAEMKTKINDWLFLSLMCKVKLLFHSVIMSSAEEYTPSEVMVSSGEICLRINCLPFPDSVWG